MSLKVLLLLTVALCLAVTVFAFLPAYPRYHHSLAPSSRHCNRNFARSFHLLVARNREERARKSREPRKNTRHTAIGQRKVSRLLRDELSDIITSCDIKATIYPPDELMRSVSIADVEYSTDFSYAKVYISVVGNSVEKRQVFVWLCNNIGQVRYSLAQRLRSLRKLPDIRFSLVDSQSNFYLDSVMDELSTADKGAGAVLDGVDFEEIDDEGDEY